jgi:uncharacterized protein YbaP (TraB family)
MSNKAPSIGMPFQRFSTWFWSALCAIVIVSFALLPRPLAAGEPGLLYGEGLLWKLERQGDEASYLFGTMHIADPRILDLPESVRGAFESSSLAVFEVIIDPQAQAQIAQLMVLSDGRTLDQILSPELFQRVVETAATYGLPEAAVRVFKPWALIPIFSFPPDQFARVAAGEAPLDDWLQQEARRSGTAIAALESIEEQLGLFDNASEADQVAMLGSAVNDRAKTLAQFNEMIEFYLARDPAGIYDQMLEQSTGDEQRLAEIFEQDFIIARNKRMAERLTPHLDGGGAFVAVGALHLPGEQGLVRLMEESGYRVTRIY